MYLSLTANQVVALRTILDHVCEDEAISLTTRGPDWRVTISGRNGQEDWIIPSSGPDAYKED